MMVETKKNAGEFMLSEIAQAPSVFAKTVCAYPDQGDNLGHLADAPAFYTFARGSSDAAANVLSYEIMRELGVPVTSLPPSVFSLGGGVNLRQSGVIVISQSGASDDLVRSAKGAKNSGACCVVGITNVPGSDVEAAADVTVPIGAGVERAVPATKTVIGSIAAGMALIAAIKPGYQKSCRAAAAAFAPESLLVNHIDKRELVLSLIRSEHVYVIGRGAGFGAAHEVALKLKETCVVHAEAYSASEVLHGPLQLVTKPLTVLILDTDEPVTRESIEIAETRFRSAGASVFRLSANDLSMPGQTPAAAAALLLYVCYDVILNVAMSLGLNPDSPDKLAKVTRTV